MLFGNENQCYIVNETQDRTHKLARPKQHQKEEEKSKPFSWKFHELTITKAAI